MSIEATHPDISIKPPLLYLGALALGIILDLIIRTDLMGWGTQFALGMLLLCAGLALLIWAVGAMTRAGTNIAISQPVLALVTKGPYRYSRNPIYLALTMMYLAFCFLFDLLFGFVLLVPVILIMNKYVIDIEELFLGNRFGTDYIDYSVHTPRWLRKPDIHERQA